MFAFVSNRHFLVLCMSATLAVVLFATGATMKHRDCLEQSPGIATNPTYSRPYHENTVAYYQTFAPFLAVLVIASIQLYFKLWSSAFYLVAYYWVGAGTGNGIVDILKKEQCSPRPYAAALPFEPNSFYSTPSGHTFQAIYGSLYVALFLAAMYQDVHVRTVIMFFASAFPLFVGASHIVDNHHWPIDVVCGALIGIWIAVLACGLTITYIKSLNASTGSTAEQRDPPSIV
jgi:membrane-associated phospholipid phosphatase